MKFSKLSALICALASLIALSPSSGVAATSTAAISVSATVLSSSCVAGTSGSARGNYAATLRDAQAAVTVACSLTTPYTVNVEHGIVATGAAPVVSGQQLGLAGAGEAFTATITY